MATTKQKFNPQDIVDEQVQQIDEALEKIERRMEPYKKLAEAKTTLLASRRALLGHGPRTTGGTTTRLTMDDVVQYLTDHPGSTPAIMGDHFGVAAPTVSSHLYRNKTRFLNREGKYWVRDPKNGLDTNDDIDDDE